MRETQPALLEFIEKMEHLGRFQDKVDALSGIDRIWRVFLEYIHDWINVEVCALFMADQDTREFVLKYASPGEQGARCEKEARLQIECGMFSWVVNRRKPAIVPAMVFKSRQTIIMAPLTTIRGTLGVVMAVTSIEEASITRENLKLLAMLARECSLVMENTLLYESLKKKHESLQSAQARIIQAEKLAAVGRLTSGACHELLNPLNILSGYVQFIRMDDDLAPSMEEYLAIIQEQSTRIDHIVKGLLKFSSPAGSMKDRVRVNRLIETILAGVEEMEGVENVAIVQDLAPDLPDVKGNTGDLSEVFSILLSNALDAMPEGGSLHVSSGASREKGDLPAGSVEIRFTDMGVGVSEEDLPKLFEPFFTTKSDEGCIGLGLSLAYGIITKHGGWIHVSSRPGRGATVTIQLPAYK
ncbi:MAG: hypothetical protein GY859_19285 [Desulfobacterales bacterium]|nr:hypothetical protein [Desulfobacterales bacterium]